MGQGFHETAHNRTDLKKYQEGIESVFGKKPPEFCDVCELRFSYCECNLECQHEWEYLRGNYKQCAQCEQKELK